MSQNSCRPEGLQPESAMAALLVLAIERLLPSPGALPSPILAATHTCFIILGTLDRSGHRLGRFGCQSFASYTAFERVAIERQKCDARAIIPRYERFCRALTAH